MEMPTSFPGVWLSPFFCWEIFEMMVYYKLRWFLFVILTEYRHEINKIVQLFLSFAELELVSFSPGPARRLTVTFFLKCRNFRYSGILQNHLGKSECKFNAYSSNNVFFKYYFYCILKGKEMFFTGSFPPVGSAQGRLWTDLLTTLPGLVVQPRY